MVSYPSLCYDSAVHACTSSILFVLQGEPGELIGFVIPGEIGEPGRPGSQVELILSHYAI